MTCAKTWHVWKCDGCGVEMNWDHGEWAEADRPTGWRTTLGWGLDACSAACQEKIEAEHQRATGKLIIFLDAGERTGIIRPFAPLPVAAQPPREGPLSAAPGVFG